VGGDPWKACKVFVLDHIRQNMVFQIENEDFQSIYLWNKGKIDELLDELGRESVLVQNALASTGAKFFRQTAYSQFLSIRSKMAAALNFLAVNLLNSSLTADENKHNLIGLVFSFSIVVAFLFAKLLFIFQYYQTLSQGVKISLFTI
jgi:hypothetical protein